MIEDRITQELARFDVDPLRGFLPPEDPLVRLPQPWLAWEQLGFDLPEMIATRTARQAIGNLPTLDASSLGSEQELRRAMLLLSVFGNAFVFSRSEIATRLPACLCLPWNDVAARLDRPMIISHASIVLHNWRRIDATGPIAAENLRTLQCFRGGPDEEWFYLLTAEIEATGAAALPALARIRLQLDAHDHDHVGSDLETIASTIDAMTTVLVRMEERCRHDVFYHRIRPFLSGWPEPGIVYEGLENDPITLHGGSAAQSSLLNALDAGLDVPHDHPRTRPFLQAMRHYMPPRHRAFLQWLEKGASLRDIVEHDGGLASRYDACIEQLVRFRRTHQEITIRYITKQAPAPSQAMGTGGTEYADFLRRTRIETSDRRLH